jgi:hypothetical protein
MQNVKVKAAFAILAVSASVAVGVATPTVARTPYDGLWSVLIVTERGDCDRGYRYPVSIVDGAVKHAPEGDQSFDIAGHVAAGGQVNVSVRRGEQYAQGSGRLSLGSGTGRWQSPSNNCAGYWEAERRG